MNVWILQWGLLSFMLGIALSLPLAAVYYDPSPPWAKVFTQPRKLKSAHLDFFTQAFAAGLVYLLEYATGSSLPQWVVIPLLFGILGNPLILLLESTAWFRKGYIGVFYRLLKSTSPVSLLFAWIAIAGLFLPKVLLLVLVVMVGAGVYLIWRHRRTKTQDTVVESKWEGHTS